MFYCAVFVLQLPAYLPTHLALEPCGRASAEFSMTLLLVNLPLSPDRFWRLIRKTLSVITAVRKTAYLKTESVQFSRCSAKRLTAVLPAAGRLTCILYYDMPQKSICYFRRARGPSTCTGGMRRNPPAHPSCMVLSYNSQFPTVLGNGTTSRMFDIPVRYITQRSNPSPNPACLAEPYLRKSM